MAKIKIKQTGSPIRRPASQRATLKGLGLDKMNRVVGQVATSSSCHHHFCSLSHSAIKHDIALHH